MVRAFAATRYRSASAAPYFSVAVDGLLIYGFVGVRLMYPHEHRLKHPHALYHHYRPACGSLDDPVVHRSGHQAAATVRRRSTASNRLVWEPNGSGVTALAEWDLCQEFSVRQEPVNEVLFRLLRWRWSFAKVFGYGLGAGTDLQLFVNVTNMIVNGVIADLERGRDFLVK